MSLFQAGRVPWNLAGLVSPLPGGVAEPPIYQVVARGFRPEMNPALRAVLGLSTMERAADC